MSIDSLRITAGKHFQLKDFDPAAKPCTTGSKAGDKERVDALSIELDLLQDKLYAMRSKRLLIVLQGMDTSGKDGTVRGVFRAFDPLGVRAVSFKAPTANELARDYLWRVHLQVPAAGEIVIFNRSHYEDVLITRVHGWIDADECARRYRQIRAFEEHLVENGTTLVKCFLHISKDEQKKRLEERLADPLKHWKFDPKDLEERQYWDAYAEAYEQAIASTATPEAPWYVIPADSKSHRNVAIADILLHTMTAMKLAYPDPLAGLADIKVT
jgi:PPK2 family polyphosphate:nucleotide phosphotransferase